MSGHRRAAGGQIDRSRSLAFRFDGQDYRGHPGDTLASALLANGVRIVGRSFKYHRPRGIWGAWVEEPNALFDVRCGDLQLVNCQATTTPLEDGMVARSVGARPSAARDAKGMLDLLHRFLPAGFYYKTFMWPTWHLFEPAIRRVAGLGEVDPTAAPDTESDQLHAHCDVLVIGAGVAGLAAAQAAAGAGRRVMLVDDRPAPGGGLHRLAGRIDGARADDWVASSVAAIESAGGRVLSRTTAVGIYDHHLVALIEERGFALAPRLWRVRAERIVLAAGAIERPLTFADNDLPGVMSADAAHEYLARYGVLVGEQLLLASNNSGSEAAVQALRAAGATVSVIEGTSGVWPAAAIGRRRVDKVRLSDGSVQACDALLVAGGWTPSVHLWCHAGGKLEWSEKLAAFLPRGPFDRIAVVGAAAGIFDVEAAIAGAQAAALGQPVPEASSRYRIAPAWPQPGSKGRQWIDLQSDVTLKDVELAVRENFVSVEHLKRYTTLGMACDQGRTSNVTGLAALAAAQGRPIAEVGTTTYRPPFRPVALAAYRGRRRRQLFNPVRRLPLEAEHLAAGAQLREYGGWLRPAFYGGGSEAEAVQREVIAARTGVAVFDGSSLGKIEVMGPDAERFLDFIFYNTVRGLKPGQIRYGFILTEGGAVYDDGVLARVDEHRFIVSCSSSHVAGVRTLLESWRQDIFDPDQIYIHDATAQWATVSVSGPRARSLLQALGLGLDLDPAAFPHMTLRDARFGDAPARVARVSFTGELGYEISVPARRAEALWRALLAAGARHGVVPIGIEALGMLRAEKGYVMVGRDTDGETMPHDLGFGGPRQRKAGEYLGKRSLFTENAARPDRRQLVGLAVAPGEPPLATGAHAVATEGGRVRSLGYVTSSYASPTLGRAIALASIAGGAERLGSEITIRHLGKDRVARVVAPVAYDPAGERIHA